MSLPLVRTACGLRPHPQLEGEDSMRTSELQARCGGPHLDRPSCTSRYTYADSATPTAKPLERIARVRIEPVGYLEALALRVLDGRHRAEEALRGHGLHLTAGRGADRRVGRDDADSLGGTVL